ncbi:MAG TPA: hypothetical protein ENK59_05605 [Thioploca sp.]|nr:hypothetical protein [Thioploca sp.]
MKTSMKGIAIFIMVFSGTVSAYVGPGAGLTLIGSLIGLVVAIVTALGIILFWPIRALIRKMRGKKPAEEETIVQDTEQKS